MNIQISAALIVKDEGACLGACLASLHTVVDEIVVVDTGSSDNTLAIAAAFTDRVYTFAWCDDFSAARNFSLERARGRYALMIDADNVIANPVEAAQHLRVFMRENNPEVVGTVEITSATSSGEICREMALRFFRRDRFRYEGAIHEQLIPIDGAIKTAPTGVCYSHSGYRYEASSPLHKSHRNIRLLEAELARHPDDDYYWFQLGKAHFALNDFQAASSALDRALQCLSLQDERLIGRKGTVSPDLLADLVTTAAYAAVNIAQAEKALLCLNKYEPYILAHCRLGLPDFHHCLGYVHLIQNNLAEATAAFEAAITCGIEAECVAGTASFRSFYHLGLVAEARADQHRADHFYALALRANPAYQPVIARCIDRVIEQRHPMSPQVWQACNQTLVTDLYLQRLPQSDFVSAMLLLEAARLLSPDLYARCLLKTA